MKKYIVKILLSDSFQDIDKWEPFELATWSRQTLKHLFALLYVCSVILYRAILNARKIRKENPQLTYELSMDASFKELEQSVDSVVDVCFKLGLIKDRDEESETTTLVVLMALFL